VVDKQKESVAGNLIEGLRIISNESIFETVKNMENLKSYVVEDEKFEGKGLKVEHDGRVFFVSEVENVDKAINILKKYPAPNKEVIEVMSFGDKQGSAGVYPNNFIVYFLNNSEFDITIPNNRNSSNIFISTDSTLATTSNVSFPGIYGYNAFDNLSYILPFNQENVKGILPLSALSIVGFTSLENNMLYQSLDTKIFYIFFNIENSENIRKNFTAPLEEFRYDLKVLLIPNLSQHVKIEKYGLTTNDLPGCISIYEDGGKYIQRNVTTENIKEFVKNVLDQKAEIYYNSQEEPENNNELNVKVVTRNNIKSYLNDVTKDRLLVFGTNGCPHCVRVKPILEELGGIAKTHADDKVMIGYCDVEENDVDNFNIRFVPTLLLYKVGSVEGIPYDGGDRNVENVSMFIRDNGGSNVDLFSFIPSTVEEVKDVDMKEEETVIPEEAKRAEL